ncbi:MAG TPA: dihydropteroate synthase [Chloroflexota bacterium]
MAESWHPDWGSRTYVMGIINVTPDSFSGDGLYRDPQAVLRLGQAMVSEGADLLDIGAESTRPGHTPISAAEELSRLMPALEVLAGNLTVPLSVDTRKAEVAARAVAAGATVVNDVSGLHDPEMASVVAETKVHVVLVHSDPSTDESDIVQSVLNGLRRGMASALRASVSEDRIIVDPGIGMRKGWRSNLTLIKHLAALRELSRPILVGPSRKATISRVLGVGAGDRLEGTAALVATSIANGADVVRVHDVRAMARVAKMVDLLAREPRTCA